MYKCCLLSLALWCQKHGFSNDLLEIVPEATNSYHPCAAITFFMVAENLSKQKMSLFFVKQVMLKMLEQFVVIVSATFLWLICLLMVQEHRQPKAACTLQPPRTGASGDDPGASGMILWVNGPGAWVKSKAWVCRQGGKSHGIPHSVLADVHPGNSPGVEWGTRLSGSTIADVPQESPCRGFLGGAHHFAIGDSSICRDGVQQCEMCARIPQQGDSQGTHLLAGKPDGGSPTCRGVPWIGILHPGLLFLTIKPLKSQERPGPNPMGKQPWQYLFLELNQTSCARTYPSTDDTATKMTSACTQKEM